MPASAAVNRTFTNPREQQETPKTPTLDARDRLLFQGLVALTLTLTLAVALQSRVLDANHEAPIPDWVRRYVPIADVVVTTMLSTLGCAIVYIGLATLSQDAPLTADDRTYLSWLEKLVVWLAFWVLGVAVARRALPVLWRRPRSQPWRLELDQTVANATIVGIALAVTAGLTLISRRPYFGLVALAALVVVFGSYMRRDSRRHDATKERTLQDLGLAPGDAQLAGFAEAEAPQIKVFLKQGSTDAWLTFAQAKDVAAAFEWAKDSVGVVDETHIRLRSVEFTNRRFRSQQSWRARQAPALSVTDGRGRPMVMRSDRNDVIHVPSKTALFDVRPSTLADERTDIG